LDEQGLQYASMTLFYSKLEKVNNFEGVLYDSNGEKVKKVKKDDIHDGSAVGNGTLFGDNRYKYAEFKYAIFPFTVRIQQQKQRIRIYFFIRCGFHKTTKRTLQLNNRL